MKSKIALIGPYPPPAGGISVHVQRLASMLEAQFDVRVLDPYRRSASGLEPLVTACGPPGPWSIVRAASAVRGAAVDLVHVHVSSMNRFAYGGHLLVSLLPRSARSILTIHSGSFVPDFQAAGWLTRVVIAALVRRFELLVAVSTEIKAQLVECGVKTGSIVVLPAFLPPDDPRSGPGGSAQGIDRNEGRMLLVSSGYGIRDYGFDVLLHALHEHDELGARCEVVLCLYNTYDDSYVSELERMLTLLPHARILRDLTPAAFSAMLSDADVYVRATNRDGDAVAIREAAHFGKSIVASDCVARPAGCQIFRTGDPDSLASALLAVLKDPQVGRAQGDEDVRARYLGLYQRCIAGW